jgi:hypothetical protein
MRFEGEESAFFKEVSFCVATAIHLVVCFVVLLFFAVVVVMSESLDQRRERILNAEVKLEFVHFEGLERTNKEFLEDTYKEHGVVKDNKYQLGELLVKLHEANSAQKGLGVFKSSVAEVRPGSDSDTVRVYVKSQEKRILGVKAGVEHNGSEPFGVSAVLKGLFVYLLCRHSKQRSTM